MALKSRGKDFINELYLNARRFDEGEIYQGRENEELIFKKVEVMENLYRKFGREEMSLFEDYVDLLRDETELECQHFFREGYRAGRKRRRSFRRR